MKRSQSTTAPGIERRANHLIHILRAAGEIEQQFGARLNIGVRRVEQNLADLLADGRAAGLDRFDHFSARDRAASCPSMRNCVVLPQPSMPSKVMNRPRAWELRFSQRGTIGRRLLNPAALNQNQASPYALHDSISSAARLELAHDRGDVELYCVLGDSKALRDQLVAVALGEQGENFDFAGCERVARGVIPELTCFLIQEIEGPGVHCDETRSGPSQRGPNLSGAGVRREHRSDAGAQSRGERCGVLKACENNRRNRGSAKHGNPVIRKTRDGDEKHVGRYVVEVLLKMFHRVDRCECKSGVRANHGFEAGADDRRRCGDVNGYHSAVLAGRSPMVTLS